MAQQEQGGGLQSGVDVTSVLVTQPLESLTIGLVRVFNLVHELN